MNEYAAYREGYSDGFNDGVEYMRKQFVKNCEETEKRQLERFSEWRKRYKAATENNDLERIEKKYAEPQESGKINCKATKCENCINYDYCDFEPLKRSDKE